MDRPIFLNDNHPENSSEANVVSKTNQEPPHDSDIHQLIEECSVEVPEQQKQKVEDTMFDLVEIFHHKQFLCIHDDIDDLIESALDSKLLSINSINSQHLEKKEQEVKNVEEQPAERRNRTENKCEVTLEAKIECDMPAKDVYSPVFTTFSNPLFKDNDDLDSSDDESLPDEDVPAEEFKIYSNSLFDEDEINFDKLDPHCFNDGNSQQEEIDIVTQTDDVLPQSVENDDDDYDLLLGEAGLFLSDNSIPPGIENVVDDPEKMSPDVIAEEISDKLNEDKCFDPGREINVSTKIEDDDYFPFMFVIRFILPYFIFPEVSSLLLSTESEDTIFDLGISD
nr:hypothetical protein [Tanacetum cinerariifolium]